LGCDKNQYSTFSIIQVLVIQGEIWNTKIVLSVKRSNSKNNSSYWYIITSK